MPVAEDLQSSGQTPFAAAEWSLFMAVSLIWGSSFVLIDLGLEGLTPGFVTLGRVGSGAITLVILRLLSNGPVQRIAVEDRVRVALVSIIWVAVPFTLFPLAQEKINSAVTGLLNGATPVFVAVFSLVMTGRKPVRSLLVGLGLGFGGVTLLSLPSLSEGSAQAGGVLMVLAATICYGIAMNLAAPLQQRYGALTLMTPVLVLASLLLIPVGLRSWSDNSFSAGVVLPVLMLGVVGTGLAYWIMATLVGRAGAVRASFITYLIPVVSLVLGVVTRGDSVAPLAIVGACVTTVGAMLASGRTVLPLRKGERDKAPV